MLGELGLSYQGTAAYFFKDQLSYQGTAAFFFKDQCHNPHAHEYADLYDIVLPGRAGSWFHVLVWETSPVHTSRYLRHVWADAFGASPDAAASRHAKSIFRPCEVPVLLNERMIMYWACYTKTALRAQQWAFRCIRAAALKRYLRAVAVIMRHTVHSDITTLVLGHLAFWHSEVGCDDALPELDA